MVDRITFFITAVAFLLLAFKLEEIMAKKKLKKKIILSSKAAGGKDFFRNFLKGEGFKPSISLTTREPRGNEVDGVDYRFVDDTEFMEMVAGDQFREHIIFQGKGYGTTQHSLDNDDVFIFTPGGINSLKLTAKERKEFIIIYFDMPLDIRINRMEGRINADKIADRLETDDKEFYGFRDFDIRVTNPYFDPEKLLKTIIDYSEI